MSEIEYNKWRITIQFEHNAHPDHDQARIEEITREHLLQDFLDKEGFEEVEMLVERA